MLASVHLRERGATVAAFAPFQLPEWTKLAPCRRPIRQPLCEVLPSTALYQRPLFCDGLGGDPLPEQPARTVVGADFGRGQIALMREA
jgi:hypothetical protein